jgi:hypothetical protein
MYAIMITVVCGEDTATSRDYFSNLKKQYTQKGAEIKDISPAELPELTKWMGESSSLFSTNFVFFSEKLDASLVRKRGRKSSASSHENPYENALMSIGKDPAIVLIDWEEKSARDLKLKDIADVKEFKPSANIFKLLDSFVPGQKTQFIRQFRLISGDQNPNFIFVMIYRHVRSLILASGNEYSSKTLPWQKSRLHAQSLAFGPDRLSKIYSALYRIDQTAKTGLNPHGIQKSLEIVACYYL